MMNKEPHSKPQKRIVLPIAALLMVMLACNFNSSTPPAGGPTSTSTSPAAATGTSSQPVIPADWKMSTYPTGSCQVSAPPDWQLGSDFFLESGKSFQVPVAGIMGNFPPGGKDLWPVVEGSPHPQGIRYQLRTAVVDGSHVCSVYRIKEATPFTIDEESLMDKVGSTLQELHSSVIFDSSLAFLVVRFLPLGKDAQQIPSLPPWTMDGSAIDTQIQYPDGTFTQDIDQKSDAKSNNGQHAKSEMSNHCNRDGSCHDHEEWSVSDGQGNKAHVTRDWYTAKDGSRTEHLEVLEQKKGGHCEKTVEDWAYDTHGVLTSHPDPVTTVVPCPVFSLQIDFAGKATIQDLNVKYGPNSQMVILEYADGTHTGKYEGYFDVEVTGGCEGAGGLPVSFDIKATEDEFHELHFSIKITLAFSSSIKCLDQGMAGGVSPTSNTITFPLPSEDGASAALGSGDVTFTFTLKDPEP